jgi:hypothetical protein
MRLLHKAKLQMTGVRRASETIAAQTAIRDDFP